MSTDNTIFNDVFLTLLEKMPQLVIPLVNEVFHTAYDKNTEIVQLRNEHERKGGERRTDSSFRIGRRIYHMECQSTSDSTMAIRMIEYDFFIALEYVSEEGGICKMEFPRSCVLYLRHNKNTKDELSVEVSLPNGTNFHYTVPVVKVQNYTKDEIFQKNLLFLLPFYIMRYEKDAEKIEANDEKLTALLAEYEDIQQRLIEKLGDGKHGREYAELVDLITRISDYIFREEEKTKKGVSGKMRGKVLELEVDKIIDEGIEKGIEERIARELPKAVERELPKAVERELPKAVERELPKAVEKEVSKALEKEVSKALETELPKAVERELPKAVEKEVAKEVAKTKVETKVETLYSIAGYTPERISEKINIAMDEVIRILRELKLLPEAGNSPMA